MARVRLMYPIFRSNNIDFDNLSISLHCPRSKVDRHIVIAGNISHDCKRDWTMDPIIVMYNNGACIKPLIYCTDDLLYYGVHGRCLNMFHYTP